MEATPAASRAIKQAWRTLELVMEPGGVNLQMDFGPSKIWLELFLKRAGLFFVKHSSVTVLGLVGTVMLYMVLPTKVTRTPGWLIPSLLRENHQVHVETVKLLILATRYLRFALAHLQRTVNGEATDEATTEAVAEVDLCLAFGFAQLFRATSEKERFCYELLYSAKRSQAISEQLIYIRHLLADDSQHPHVHVFDQKWIGSVVAQLKDNVYYELHLQSFRDRQNEGSSGVSEKQDQGWQRAVQFLTTEMTLWRAYELEKYGEHVRDLSFFAKNKSGKLKYHLDKLGTLLVGKDDAYTPENFKLHFNLNFPPHRANVIDISKWNERAAMATIALIGGVMIWAFFSKEV